MARVRGAAREERAREAHRERADRAINRCTAFLSQLRTEEAGRPYTHHLGEMNHECENCLAVHFIDERTDGGFSLCCSKGDSQIDNLRAPPPELVGLLTDDTPRARAFRKEIRKYNSALAFTSVSYTKDERVNLRAGIQCFQIHGELFHYQGPLQAEDGRTPSFAQLFFYDPDYATDVRMDRYPQLDRTVLTELLHLLTAHNPFIEVYKTARERLQGSVDHRYRLLLNPQMRLILEQGADRRRENLPTHNELAIILSDEFEDASRRDIVLELRNPGGYEARLSRIDVTHAAYMPLHYVLLFPRGDPGWHYNLLMRNGNGPRQRTRLGQRMFYRYRLHVRNREFSTLFYSGRLFQQYVVDAFAACESTTLDWLRRNQQNIRADVYQGLQDNLLAGDANAAELGRKVVLPSSFVGGDRAMQQYYQDSMAIVRYFGTPTFFLTFTANPRWEEIVENLLPGQQPADRPDLIARVFNLKKKQLLTDIKHGYFGPYRAYVYTIEYQKRGLPHMHILIWLTPEARFLTQERINEVICAELPDPSWDPTGEITDIVISQMVHGPCGEDYPNAPCMGRKYPNSPRCCQKGFPKPFAPETVVHEDRYPEYRRRDDGRTFQVRNPGKPGEFITLNNRWIVPYNPYLLRRYKCHMNVEICATVQAVKYIHKYIYKGSDRTTVQVGDQNNEITRYIQGRYIGPSEAVWRIFEFTTHQEFPPVEHLPVHLDGKHTVYFGDHLTEAQLYEKKERARSKLMGWFLYNEQRQDGHQYLYQDFPTHFVWHKDSLTWQRRKQGYTIGRMYHCSPVSGERYYLRLLLTVVTGAKSYEELYLYEGLRYPTYHAACIARGLAESDQEWYHCFDEAILFTPGRGLRTLFLTGLRQQAIADPTELWSWYKDSFCDDLLHRLSTTPVSFPRCLAAPHYDYGLWCIAQGLADQQRSLTDASLPENIVEWSDVHESIIRQDDIAINQQLADDIARQLNTGQQECYRTIIDGITADPTTAHYYLQGPGGTGKTFLYKALYYYFRSRGKVVLCVASTGIAGLLLPNGQTSHSQFKIPLDLHEASVSSISKTSKLATELKSVDLIIWDEVPMQHKYCFEVVHRLFCDLRSVPESVLFGGVPVLLGGDFAQILPVVPQGSRADIIKVCLQRSFIWLRTRKLYLRENMRVRNTTSPDDIAFVQWISSLSYDAELSGQIKIPSYITQPVGIIELISKVYPDEILTRPVTDHSIFKGRVLLSALNTSVVELNSLIHARYPGQERIYNSINTSDLKEGDEAQELPVEHLQSIDLPSLPPAKLRLKVGEPVMLLRNLCPKEGLCNGSRMVITGLRNHCIEGRLLRGDFDGQLRTIPRIKLTSGDKDLTFTLTRKQFPVRLCFAMTINKSQGQSFETVGLDLRTPVFSHGQFYVAVSRVCSARGLSILLPEDFNRTVNIVWSEILQDLRYLLTTLLLSESLRVTSRARREFY